MSNLILSRKLKQFRNLNRPYLQLYKERESLNLINKSYPKDKKMPISTRTKSVAKKPDSTATKGARGKSEASVKVAKGSPEKSKSLPKKKFVKARAAKKSVERSDRSASEDLNQAQVTIHVAGDYLAFVDPSAVDLKHFKIARILQDVTIQSNEILCDIYESEVAGSFSFKLSKKKKVVNEQTVICDAKVQVVESSASVIKTISINKTLLNKTNKLVGVIIEALQAENSDQTESEENQSGEESEESEKAPLTQNPKNRRILKIKGPKNPPATQVVSNKPILRERKKKEDNEDMQIVSSGPVPKKDVKMPVIGKRRRKQSMSDHGDAVEEKKTNVRKQRKVGSGSKERVEIIKVVPVKAKPVVYKKGVWNPDIEIVDFDPEIEDPSDLLRTGCCTQCTNRNFRRAVLTNNSKLMQKVIFDQKRVSWVGDSWGPDFLSSGMDTIMKTKNYKMLEQILHPELKVPKTSTYVEERTKLFQTGRVKNEEWLLRLIQQGRVSKYAYGTAIRQVGLSRGNRQGNQAFMQKNQGQYIGNFYFEQQSQRFFSSKEDIITIQKLMGGDGPQYDVIQQLSNSVFSWILQGQFRVCEYILSKIHMHSHFGYNELHWLALKNYKKGEKMKEFKSVSVAKKGTNCWSITPLHFACINPNTEVLKQLLAVNGDTNMMDVHMRKPIHFAAVCESVENLKYLIEEKNVSIIDISMQKETPLHYAAGTGRVNNVKYLISKNQDMFLMKDKTAQTPFGKAVQGGHEECIKVLFETGNYKLNVGIGRDRMQPLHYAARDGNYELCQWLIENKARTISNDKFKRTPLILAVRNGHLKVASLLLKYGADWTQPDSSNNTPLHFAAAYGWPECMKLLLKTGADINAENSWRITPINIAMLMNHELCVKMLLDYPEVDVNCKDETGKTLLTMALLTLKETSVEFVKYLLNKGADPNITDIDDQNALHFLAQTSPKYVPNWNETLSTEEIKLKNKVLVERQLQLADVLVEKGASLSHKDKKGLTPFAACLEFDNIDLLNKLTSQVSLNKESELLFAFKEKILNQRYQEILFTLLNNDKPTKATMNILDSTGMTPFLVFFQKFTNDYANIRATMLGLVDVEAAKHQGVVSKYEINNEILFNAVPKQAVNTNNFGFGGFGNARRKATAMKSISGFSFGNSNNFQQTDVIQQEVPLARKNEITDQLMEQYVVEPFIICLKNLVSHGADANAQVQKLEKFRDIEAERKLLALANKLTYVPLEKEIREDEKGLTRDEVLKKREQEKREKVAERALALKNKECEYQSQFGLQNVFHMVTRVPHQRLLDTLSEFGVNPDAPDHKKMTPFNYASTNVTPIDQYTLFNNLLNFFIHTGIQIDSADAKGRTAFLNYVANNKKEEYEKMLQLGANINQMDVTGLFALKYVLIRRENEVIQNFVQRGADINKIDTKGRNLLHHAVNMSSATADATFETEATLIDLGININLIDRNNRTPLHYAFVKIKNWNEVSAIDPIETVSSLCGCKGLQMDVPDKWNKTPLHYAAQRGASICQIYLFKRGVNKEAKDIYGNTPLAISILKKHHNSAIIMIQKECSVNELIFEEDPERIKREWKEKGINKDQIMQNEQEEAEEKEEAEAKHRKLFEKNKVQNSDDDYNEQDDEDEDEDDEEGEDEQFEQNAFNNQNAFNQPVFNKLDPAAKTEEMNKKEPTTMFRMAIQDTQLGLAYSMLDEGYNLMQAMQDAMDEQKFMLCLTLLSKYQDDKIVQQKNAKKQNLFHILSQNSNDFNIGPIKRIYQTLKKRGVNCLEVDGLGKTALHYSIQRSCLELIRLLIDEGADPKTLDKDGKSAIILYLEGRRCENKRLYDAQLGKYDQIFELLAQAGADMNQVYVEKTHKSEFDQSEYKCTVLMNIVRHFSKAKVGTAEEEEKNPVLRSALLGLMNFGASLDISDSDGRDAMMYAIKNNNMNLASFLLQNKKALNLKINLKDKMGRNAIHYVVNPCSFGSYENSDLLEALFKEGYSLDHDDSTGKKPIDYAKVQQSGVMLKCLLKLKRDNGMFSKMKSKKTFTSSEDWPSLRVDYDHDSQLMMEAAKLREQERLLEKVQNTELVPVDKVGQFERSYKVFVEGVKPWDAYLTKVDLKNGIYGDYVFYKMQMVYDSNRDLYVVFTRYGRIGEDGMHQRTPFPKLEEAKKEFCSIFKSKTGNDFTDLENFTKVKKKYNLSKVNYVTSKHHDFLAPFDYEKCPKSQLEKNVRQLLEEVGNVTMYQKAFNRIGLNQEVLPISNIKKEVLEEAMGYLKQLQVKIGEDQLLCQGGLNVDIDKLTEVRDSIQELSSKFYEIIPFTKFKDQVPEPLSNQSVIKQQYEAINSLIDIERASKILLGALFRQNEIHPSDYLHKALNLKIEFMMPTDPEHEAVLDYVKAGNAANRSWNPKTHKLKIFKIERKGEAERYSDFKDLPNQRLLFHGSSLFNYIGMLSQGMRIAPPEAPSTGYMFGKGLYFADMFEKSAAYCRSNASTDFSTILVLCDVALGKQKKLYEANLVEHLDPPFNSVHGVGKRGPDYEMTLMHPEGIQIPSGAPIDYPYDNYQKSLVAKNTYAGLASNEFVVYNTSQVRMRYLLQIVKKTKEELEKEQASK